MLALGFGLTELLTVILIAIIPPIIIYFDAKKKGKNPLFWALIVFVGLFFWLVPGILLILIYVLHQNQSNKSENVNEEKAEGDIKEVLRFFSENERIVLECLIRENVMTQNELVAKTELSPATISRIIGKLERKGIIIRYRNGVAKKVELRDEFLG
ncbi:MAG: winged helix-turn-helix transcriptional regulator [Archaeoglobaceae archaeon]